MIDKGCQMKLLILSDIHGNWPALEAVLAAEPEHDAVVFCGDVVDYGPQPVECLRWLRSITRPLRSAEITTTPWASASIAGAWGLSASIRWLREIGTARC